MNTIRKLEKILGSVKRKLSDVNGYLIVKQAPIKTIQNKYPKFTEDEYKSLLKQAYRLQKIKKYRRT